MWLVLFKILDALPLAFGINLFKVLPGPTQISLMYKEASSILLLFTAFAAADLINFATIGAANL